MSSPCQKLVDEITGLHRETVVRWHTQELDNTYDGFLQLVCRQHQFNFLLWHEEDIARSPEAGDARIAEVKRAIDGYNQQRNDWIERLDDHLLAHLKSIDVAPDPTAPLNTETPGSAIDRLSIMALRIYHLREQLARQDVPDGHYERVREKLRICEDQIHDLSQALVQLLEDLYSSRKRLKLYRQMKMYNDPS